MYVVRRKLGGKIVVEGEGHETFTIHVQKVTQTGGKEPSYEVSLALDLPDTMRVKTTRNKNQGR